MPLKLAPPVGGVGALEPALEALVRDYTKICLATQSTLAGALRSSLREECPHDLVRLLRHDLADKVCVTDGCLVVLTRMVMMDGGLGRVKKMGVYLVIVNPNYTALPLLCLNQTTTMNKNNGVHIHPNGTFCIPSDSREHVMHRYVSRGKLADLALYALDLLPVTNGQPVGGASFSGWPHIE
jgi:hypothetical protein